MQGVQLSPLPAAERAGRPTVEEGPTFQAGQKTDVDGVGISMPSRSQREDTPFSKPSPSKVEKRTRKPNPIPATPYLQPLPTIETLMSYPSLSRPVYDSLKRGEEPAKTYKTIIHTPKPPNMRPRFLDNNLLRAFELSNLRRRKRANSGARSRSSTVSSTASSGSTSLASSTSSLDTCISGYSLSDISRDATGETWTSKATVASSSPVPSPRYSLFPMQSLTVEKEEDEEKHRIINSTETEEMEIFPTPSIEIDGPMAPMPISSSSSTYSTTSSSSPSQSFHSASSTLDWLRDVDHQLNISSSTSETTDTDPESSLLMSAFSTPSTRSSAPSPTSSAYPSRPCSPGLAAEDEAEVSRRSSSSGEEFVRFAYGSSSSPSAFTHDLVSRERRAFSFPSPPPAPLLKDYLDDEDSTGGAPEMRRLGSTKNRSLSVDSNPWNPAGTAHDAARTAFDLGERVLGGGGIDDDDAGEKEDFGTGKGFNFEWSLDGGEIMFLDEHGDEVDRHQEEHYDDDDEDPVDVVFGAAGVALSPRAMKGRERDCCGCCCGGGRGMGLGLYVIEEEGEEMEVDGERQGGVRI